MKRMLQRSAALAAVTAIAIATITVNASAAKSSGNAFQIYGRVLKIDQKAQTALVADKWSKKLYLVHLPEGATVSIIFGRNSKMAAPQFKDLNKNDRIQARVSRTDTEHLARLEDGRQVIVVSVAK